MADSKTTYRLLSVVAFGLFCLFVSSGFREPTSTIEKQYKRTHQDLFRLILKGEADEAIIQLQARVKDSPKDAESHYMLAVAYAQLEQVDNAVAAMKQAMALGMPGSRFVGGTLTGLNPLRAHPAYQAILKDYAHRPVAGPMLGCMTSDSVRVWLRTAGEADVEVVADTSQDFTAPIRSAAVRTSRGKDYTANAVLKGLKPKTRYYYYVNINGKRDDRDPVYELHTAPVEHRPTKFRIVFGGGAGYVPQHERVWDVVRSYRPDALLTLGDNVYIDDPTSPPMQHYCYYRRQTRPEWLRLVSTTPVYAIWDDHDFGTNDCHGGPIVDDPKWKPKVWNVFRNNWVNPGYGQPENPGCYYDFRIGDVHFVMLDGRYYRTPDATKDHPKSMLGDAQERWLMETVTTSDATFKVLCSPVPWTFEAKDDSPDTWNGYREQRNRIFKQLSDASVDGIVLMSADRHRSDLWRIERPGDNALYEFNSSRFTNQHVHETMAKAEFSYNAKQSFGLVEFDTQADQPTVTYRIISIDGEEVFLRVLKPSRSRR